jgi:cytochrome c nitrite reductase small subunit
MKFTLSKRFLFVASLLCIAGTALAAFLLLGPPHLLTRSESPDFCASCHVMEEQYTAWRHAGAHRNIRCVDCHLPNNNPARHYLWKSIDGMKDVIAFHSGRVPDPITLSRHGQRVVQENCVACHRETVSVMDTRRSCWQCHRQTRHKLTGIVADRKQPSHQGDEQ